MTAIFHTYSIFMSRWRAESAVCVCWVQFAKQQQKLSFQSFRFCQIWALGQPFWTVADILAGSGLLLVVVIPVETSSDRKLARSCKTLINMYADVCATTNNVQSCVVLTINASKDAFAWSLRKSAGNVLCIVEAWNCLVFRKLVVVVIWEFFQMNFMKVFRSSLLKTTNRSSVKLQCYRMKYMSDSVKRYSLWNFEFQRIMVRFLKWQRFIVFNDLLC